MYIRDNSVNFTSRIIPSEPLKNTFDRFATEKDFLYRKTFVNNINAIINDGKQDIVEIKEIEKPNGKMIRGYINGKYTTSIIIDESRRYHTQTDCVANVVTDLARRLNPINKLQKFGLRKLQELKNSIF